MDVAFTSSAFTRNLYKGLVQIQPIKAIGLPDEEDAVEGLTTGGGADAYLAVAALEGQWKEDIDLLEQEMYHEGIRDLSGAAHVGRSSTAWSNVNENQSKAAKKKTGKALPYHVPSGWGKGGQAIWPEDEEPFYLYVQDPATVRLIFSIMDDDMFGEGDVIGSAYLKLSDVIPQAKLTQHQLIEELKRETLERIQKGDLHEVDLDDVAKVELGARTWQDWVKMTSKPKKKDKKGQVALGVAAGAAVAGPLGAVVGGVMMNMYEGDPQGRIEVKVGYLPFPQTPVERMRYTVLGGMPGITWGDLYNKYIEKASEKVKETSSNKGQEEDLPTGLSKSSLPGMLQLDDLEQCFFIKHSKTGGACVVYRSLNKRVIIVSFRGTCEPKDLVTDVKLAQEAWVEGEDVKDSEVAKVHTGFRSSMESISRRLKELILATVAPGEDISDYDMFVTGHSLGGALSTLFTADVGEYGIDAGRALPQLAESEPWWKSITNTFMGQEAQEQSNRRSPPRPKSLHMYNFGSPRVGNAAFAERFDSMLKDGRVQQAYRIVNGDDIVTRVPRTTPPIGVQYEHVGSTVLINTEAEEAEGKDGPSPSLWVEGETDQAACPVRDLDLTINSPIAEGALLGDLIKATMGNEAIPAEGEPGQGKSIFGNFNSVASRIYDRVKTIKATDLASIVGIDREFSEREFKIIESFATGKALANHMEDDYYAALGRASGFKAVVGEEITPLC